MRSETSIYIGYNKIAKVNLSTANIFKLSATPVPNHAQKSSPSGRKYDFLIVGTIAKESINKLVTRATTGLLNITHRIILKIAPNRQIKSVLLFNPPSPYLIDNSAIEKGPINSTKGTHIVLTAPEA